MRNNFCEFCGNSLSEGKCNCTEAVENRNKKSSKLKRTIPIAVICTVAIALAAVLIMLLTNASKVDPLEFTEVTFDGYEGNGTVNVEFELDDLIEEIVGEEPDDIDSVEFAKWHNKSEIYEEGIEYKVEPSKGLSNGDTVKVSFIISDMASKKVNATTKEYVVSGLEEVKHIDIFEGINVNFEGISGDGTATIKFSSKSIISDGTGLTLDRSFDLSNGDVVTLKVSDIDYFAEELQIVPTVLKKTYTVTGLSSYVESADQIPADIIKNIADQYIAQQTEELSKKTGPVTYDNVRYYGSYLFVSKEDSIGIENNILEIFIVYDSYKKGELSDPVYKPLKFENVMIDENCEVNIGYEDGVAPEFTYDIEDHMTKKEEYDDIFELD